MEQHSPAQLLQGLLWVIQCGLILRLNSHLSCKASWEHGTGSSENHPHTVQNKNWWPQGVAIGLLPPETAGSLSLLLTGTTSGGEMEPEQLLLFMAMFSWPGHFVDVKKTLLGSQAGQGGQGGAAELQSGGGAFTTRLSCKTGMLRKAKVMPLSCEVTLRGSWMPGLEGAQEVTQPSLCPHTELLWLDHFQLLWLDHFQMLWLDHFQLLSLFAAPMQALLLLTVSVQHFPFFSIGKVSLSV